MSKRSPQDWLSSIKKPEGGTVVATIIIIVVVAIFLIFTWAAYNSLVRLRNRTKNAWAQIDVQLRRRYDLIPNLIETVKGYAEHEKETFDAVIQARSSAMAATGPADQAQNENFLEGTLKSLFALSEAYPDLKANVNFLELQEELTSTESRIAFARQHFNDSVLGYNNKIEVFPSNLIAGLFKFEQEEFYEVEGEAEGPVQVQF